MEKKYSHHNLLCMACLSASRDLKLLENKPKQYYLSILEDVQRSNLSAVVPRVCWECEAVLKNGMRFREQVKESYRKLRASLITCRNESLNVLLYKLSSPPRLVTHTNEPINIQPRKQTCESKDECTTDDKNVFDKTINSEHADECTIEDNKIFDNTIKTEHTNKRIGEMTDCIDICDDSDNSVVDSKDFVYRSDITNNVVGDDKSQISESNPNDLSTELMQDVSVKIEVQVDPLDYNPDDDDDEYVPWNEDEQETEENLEDTKVDIKKRSLNKKRKVTKEDESSVNRQLRAKQSPKYREKIYECELCQRTFTQKYNLKNHMKSHRGEQQFECDVCQLKFVQNSVLKKHMITHTEQRPFECDYCHRDFKHKGSLKEHIRTHTGEKPFKCDLCPSSFVHSRSYNKHMLSHAGARPYECDVCNRTFTQSGSLKVHMRTHTGDKPFECFLCRQKFTYGMSFKNHMKTHLKQDGK